MGSIPKTIEDCQCLATIGQALGRTTPEVSHRLSIIATLPVWLPLSVFALVVWAAQPLLSKVALQDLGTGKFYLL
jgi:hypothetical protein